MNCICCNSNKFKNLVKFKKFPYLNTSVPIKSKVKEKFDQLNYLYCKNCYHIIIDPRPKASKLNSLYESFYSYVSPLANKNISPTRDNNFLLFVEPWIKKNKRYSKVFEIGCFDGYILSKLKKHFKYHEGYDPSNGAKIGKKFGLNIKKKFFDSNTIPKAKFDIIISRHVIEHIYNPRKFIKNILSIMNEEAVIIIETPNFEYFIENSKTECFSFQHVSCFNYFSLVNLFMKFGLIPFKKKINENLIIFFRKGNSTKLNLHNNKNIYSYINYKKKYINQKKNILNLISNNFDKTKKFLVWGAGGYAISLIYHFNIDINKVLFFIDNNKNNKNKKFIGFNSEIKLPNSISNYLNNFDFILIASMYHNDILNQIKRLRIPTKVIILPSKVIQV